MADDIASAVLLAARAVLLADADLVAEVGQNVLDEPRDNLAPPYIRFGSLEPARDDTDGCLGWSVTMALHVYTRPGAGRISAQRICGRVSDILHRDPDAWSVPGFTVWEVEATGFSVERQADGKTYEGTILVVVSLTAA